MARREEDNLTIVMSTHLTDEAERSDRVIFLNDGQIVADDAPGLLRRRLGDWRVTVTDESWSPPENEVDAWNQHNGEWTTLLRGYGRDAGNLARTLAEHGTSFTMAPPSLADAFEALTGRPLEGPNDPYDNKTDGATS